MENFEEINNQRRRGVRVRGGGRGGQEGRGQGRGGVGGYEEEEEEDKEEEEDEKDKEKKEEEEEKEEGEWSNEIRATVVNHMVNHGLTMQEAGQRVQPNISRFSVASILWTFRRGNRDRKSTRL